MLVIILEKGRVDEQMTTGKKPKWYHLLTFTVNNDVTGGDNDDSNNLNNIFNNATNRLAEKSQSNLIFNNFDTDNTNNRPVTYTKKSDIKDFIFYYCWNYLIRKLWQM